MRPNRKTGPDFCECLVADWKGRHLPRLPCGHIATYVVAGRKMCMQHASIRAMQIAIVHSIARPIAGAPNNQPGTLVFQSKMGESK